MVSLFQRTRTLSPLSEASSFAFSYKSFLVESSSGGAIPSTAQSMLSQQPPLGPGPCYLLAMERVDVKPTTTSGEVRFETKSSSTGCLGLPR